MKSPVSHPGDTHRRRCSFRRRHSQRTGGVVYRKQSAVRQPRSWGCVGKSRACSASGKVYKRRRGPGRQCFVTSRCRPTPFQPGRCSMHVAQRAKSRPAALPRADLSPGGGAPRQLGGLGAHTQQRHRRSSTRLVRHPRRVQPRCAAAPPVCSKAGSLPEEHYRLCVVSHGLSLSCAASNKQPAPPAFVSMTACWGALT